MSPQAAARTEEQEVMSANRAFYQALEALDFAKMAAVWLHEDWVECLHPGWDLIEGWEEIQESWTNIFRSTRSLRVSISRPLIRVLGESAWVSCLENVTSTYDEGFSTAVIETTNIFVRRDGRWLMVHHHTTPLPDRLPSGTSRTVQ
jgi:ketosteroid isomerase-like protein